MTQALGERMVANYEYRTRYMLPRRTYTIIRVDGKTFHSLELEKPFDETLTRAMNEAAFALCEEAQGCRFAYAMSDEISFLLTDFEKTTTEAWFDANLQKIVSVSSSIVTAAFNENFDTVCHFDARVFTIPDPVEVENYFIWRQRDCVRNSISMLARSLYSHKQCDNKNSSELQEMCFKAGKNWNDVSVENKRGRVFERMEFSDKDIKRHRWEVFPAFSFTEERESLVNAIHGGGS